jgi:glycine betaine/proline transport system ATP-binding protein
MQQRVGLARALANDAPILLMDEAYSALDPLIRVDMQTMLLDLHREIGKTIVFITHDLDEALRLGDRIAILRDGEVVQQGTGQDIVLHPADGYVSSFVREVNRAKVIRLGRLVQPLPENGIAMPSLSETETIDKGLRTARSHGVPALAVIDAAGRPMGLVSVEAMTRALVAEEG